MSRILITGKNSFVGSNFRKYSQFKDLTEVSLHDMQPEEIDYKGFNVVLHLAAIVRQSKGKKPAEFFRINRDLTKDVAICAKKQGVNQFVFLSTIKVYGSLKVRKEPTTEDSCCLPENTYGQSKYEAEEELKKLADKDFTVSIIRTPLVYGEGVKANMLKLIKLVENVPLLPFARIDNKRNFTFAENLVGYVDRIIEKRACGTFIAMDIEPISTTDLIKHLSNELGTNPILFKVPYVIIKSLQHLFPHFFEQFYGSLVLDNSKTREILDFSPSYTIDQGLQKMISFYLYQKGISGIV